MHPPRSLGRRVHLAGTILLAAAVVGILSLALAGVLDIRLASRRADAPAEPPGPADPRPRVEPVGEPDRYFRMLGQSAHCFRYDGGPVDCWIEVTAGGRRTVLGADLGLQLRGAVGAGPPGYILWVRRQEGGAEVWDLVIAGAGPGGEVAGTAYLRGVRPPEPEAAARGESEGREIHASQPLAEDQEVALYAVTSFGEGGGKVVRTAVLKCRAVAGGRRTP